jgi:hypothetical protein
MVEMVLHQQFQVHPLYMRVVAEAQVILMDLLADKEAPEVVVKDLYITPHQLHPEQ